MRSNQLQAIIKPENIKVNNRINHVRLFGEVSNIVNKAQIAESKGNREDVIEECKKGLKVAQKYDMTLQALILASTIQRHYNYIGECKTASSYQKIRSHYRMLFNIQNEINEAYAAILCNNRKEKHTRKTLEALNNFHSKYYQYYNLNDSKIKREIAVVTTIKGYLENDLNLVIKTNSEIIEYLESKKMGFFAGFYNYMIPALILQKNFHTAERVIQKAILNTPKGHHHLDVFNYSFFLLKMHRGSYKEAYGIIDGVRESKSAALKDRILIAKGYLNFLIQIEKIEGIKPTKLFRVGKFLNEINEKSIKDKQGFNVDVKIIQMLNWLIRDKDSLIDNQEAIERYTYRYLKGRSKMFLEIFNSFAKYKFDKSLIESKNKERIEKMKKERFSGAEVVALEVVPFERLLGYCFEVI